jgi:hypothetical protein
VKTTSTPRHHARRKSTKEDEAVNNPNFEKLFSNIIKWMDVNLSSDEFKEFKRLQIGYVVAEEWQRRLGIVEDYPEPFSFPKEIEREHALIIAFFHLKQSHVMLSQCEYYFRRFPFRRTPISRDDHVRNMCEFYFGCFYIIRSRLKEVLNKLKDSCPHSRINLGAIIKQFDKIFDYELRSRNRVHHHQPYDDVEIDRIVLPRLLSVGEMPHLEAWERRHVKEYRKYAKIWADKAHKQSNIINIFVELVAELILNEAKYLQYT